MPTGGSSTISVAMADGSADDPDGSVSATLASGNEWDTEPELTWMDKTR